MKRDGGWMAFERGNRAAFTTASAFSIRPQDRRAFGLGLIVLNASSSLLLSDVLLTSK